MEGGGVWGVIMISGAGGYWDGWMVEGQEGGRHTSVTFNNSLIVVSKKVIQISSHTKRLFVALMSKYNDPSDLRWRGCGSVGDFPNLGLPKTPTVCQKVQKEIKLTLNPALLFLVSYLRKYQMII